jgi:hypothetical protein
MLKQGFFTESYMIPKLLDKREHLSPVEFKQQFQMKKTPVIISNALDCAAIKKWDIHYFKEKYTDKVVNLDLYSIDQFQWENQELKLPNALDLICNNSDKNKKHYLMQKSIPEEFPEILPDIQLPKYADPQTNYFINLWIGESGIISQAHYDCSDNFLTQIVGRKRVRLFPPSESHKMYPYEIDSDYLVDKSAAHISKIQDTDLVNSEKFPHFNNVTCFEGIISPGDLLFIPAGWWHEVKSLDLSMSVNYWWKTEIFDLANVQATNWMGSTYFYFSNKNFSELVNKFFDITGYSDNIEIAEISLLKNLPCIAAVFLLDYFDKLKNSNERPELIRDKIPEWEKYLHIAKHCNNALLDEKVLANIIATIKNHNLILTMNS